jgi:hypothetical protein
MPHHQERPASALAHGPAKPSDIERVRRQLARAEAQHATKESVVERAIGEMTAACVKIRKDLNEVKGAGEGPLPEARPRGRQSA